MISKTHLIIGIILILITGILLGYLSTLDIWKNCTSTSCGYVDFWTWLKCHTIMYCD